MEKGNRSKETGKKVKIKIFHPWKERQRGGRRKSETERTVRIKIKLCGRDRYMCMRTCIN